jgi:FkbM family methyltransferase
MSLRVQGADFSLIIPPDSPNAVHFRRVYERNGQYEAVMSAVLARLLATMDRPVFADLGAFLGYYTVYAARLLAGRGQVFAVESNPRYAEIVRAALALNDIEGVSVLQAALSDRDETLWSQGTTLHDGSTREDAIFLATPEHAVIETKTIPGCEGEAVAVQAMTLDSLCKAHGLAPTIAKMDVHGTEGKIIRGMRQVLRGPLQCLLLELHQNVYLRKYAPDITRMAILDELEDAGFRNYYVAGHRYTYSDGLKLFLESGRFSYQPLTRETREMLLFDRSTQVFVLSVKFPLESVLGPSAFDPGLE